MTDDERMPDGATMAASLPGQSAIIVRGQDRATVLARAERLQDAVPDVLVSAALTSPPARLGAAGLHIPEPATVNWRRTDIARLGPLLVTASAHGLPGLRAAARLGVDAVLLSPVFPTKSHPGRVPLGLFRFAALAWRAEMPVFALGGVAAGQVRRVLMAGAVGVAGIGLFAQTRQRR